MNFVFLSNGHLARPLNFLGIEDIYPRKIIPEFSNAVFRYCAYSTKVMCIAEWVVLTL
jgi:hypothetical protein